MRRVIDTNRLINWWEDSRRGRGLGTVVVSEVEEWAFALIRVLGTRAIVTPVRVEFLAGVRSAHELNLARAFLEKFEVVDDHRVSPEDWEAAERMASRVPRDSARRQLGDCLIRALAQRKGHSVDTADRRFPWSG